ncbi:MAG: oxidoreductase [Gemmatimonadetes bacterium]|nr:MAG: oxidoreductase [Gemmatimonadota bacterium]
MLNVGLVGFGFAGKTFHAPVIRAVQGLRLTTIVQRSGAPPDPRYPDVEFVRSVQDLLTRAIDLVVIATPNPSHHPIAKQCLLAGRHVVIDKPFTTTAAEAAELVRLAHDKRRVLSAYQNRRYVGDFVTVQTLLSDGGLGRVSIFESHFDRFRPELRPTAWREQPQPGSGIWFDLGSHLLDQALVLFGPPAAISADIRIEREGAATDDAFDVTLHYPRMRALLRASMLAASPGPTFAVHGTRGSFVKYGLDPQEEALKSGRTPDERNWDAEPPERHGVLTTPEGTRTIPTIPSSFTHYYENVRDAIRGTAPLAVSTEQVLEVMCGLELALASSQQRCVLPWTTSERLVTALGPNRH